jgi:hypothetical protein
MMFDDFKSGGSAAGIVLSGSDVYVVGEEISGKIDVAKYILEERNGGTPHG